MQGLINILKPTGLTSSDVVVKVRGILRSLYGERYKVGHLGTLDPGACGVLVIAVGSATKLFDILSPGGKKYRASITFGKTTDTLDSYGKITEISNLIPTESQMIKAVSSFIGEIDQIPPNYSALSINGTRAYDLARSGKEFLIEARKVEINNIEIIDKINDNTYILDITCMGGTYIRSLVRDIALKLNTVAYMSSLIRLSCGSFIIENSITLQELIEKPEINTVESILINYKRYEIADSFKKNLINGVPIILTDMPDEKFLLYLENNLFAIAHGENNKLIIDIRL